jgi:DNA-binding transcriptional regulator YdaS (Cro superfamily)
MTKTDLIKALGTSKALADLLGLSKGRISQMPDSLPRGIVDRVIGSAVRRGEMGKIKHLIKKVRDE